MKNFFSAVLLSSALLVPAAVLALDHHEREEHEHARIHRYYDRDRKDWHEWNEHEDRAYRRYLEQQRREYRDWNDVPRREQSSYWRWRHAHRDDDDR